MRLDIRSIGAAIVAISVSIGAYGSDDNLLKIGLITDMSGPYSDLDGTGGVQMAKWAIEDFGGRVNGKRVVLISADHQNKAEIASSIAREWFEKDDVKMLIGGTNSAALLAMSSIASGQHRPFLATGAAVSRLTNEDCNAYTIHYSPYDTSAATKVTMKGLVKNGAKSVFFIGSDYTFGKSLVQSGSKEFKRLGGDIAGVVYAPLGTTDWASFLLQADAKRPDVVALANAGRDLQGAVTQAAEFQLTKKSRLAGFTVTANDLDALPIDMTKGLLLVDSWYWEQSADARDLSERFHKVFGRMPTSLQVADYSAVLTYLKAVERSGVSTGPKIMEAMKSMKIDDVFNNGFIRSDGRLMHDVYQYEVEKSEVKGQKYTLKRIATVNAGDAFISSAESICPLLKK